MSLRIQVVDDSSTIQKVIKIAFAPYPVEVVASGSYVEALTEIQNKRPNLLIIDANISGPKTLADITRLQAEAGNVPVLLLRGSYDGIDEQAFEQAGYQQILRKPFESSDIVREAGKLINLAPANRPAATPPPPPQQPRPVSPPPGVSTSPMEPPQMFMDLSDTTGHSVPLPPPVREMTRTGQNQKPMEILRQAELNALPDMPREQDEDEYDQPGSFHLEEPSYVTGQDQIMGFSDEVDETLISKNEPLPPQFSLNLGSDYDDDQANASPIPTSNLKGKKAFQSPMEPSVPRVSEAPSRFGEERSVLEDFKGDVADIRLEIARQMREQLPQLVRESVESYCAIHFPKIAREIVTAELRRLADEKARHLIDN